MFIILSGQYVSQELALHFGALPPAFLPVGAERLFRLQAAARCEGEGCILSLPTGFEVDTEDFRQMTAAGIDIIYTSPSLGLCEAIRQVLPHVPEGEEVKLLFGDTLVHFPEEWGGERDFVAVKPTAIDYPWIYAREDGDRQVFEDYCYGNGSRAVCGFFGFSDAEALRESFLAPTLQEALSRYSERRRLKLCEAEEWFDFGHLTLFYQAKRDLLVARAFNDLRSDGYSIIKTSHQTQKIRAEANWYEHVPTKIALHTPRYIGEVSHNFHAGYQLEYLYQPTLSDISVFGRISLPAWKMILSKCVELLSRFTEIRPDPSAPEADPAFAARFHEDIFVGKTWSRLSTFCLENDLSIDSAFVLNGQQLPSLRQIVEELISYIAITRPEDICFWHGDFFFGNLFFDFNPQRVIMVDPRGQLSDGSFCQFGDIRYDIGKLSHSALGGYDRIIMGRCFFKQYDPLTLEFDMPDITKFLEEGSAPYFLETIKTAFGLGEATVRALGAIMFFSMLPLHKDAPDRQMRLLASGLQQYRQLKGVR